MEKLWVIQQDYHDILMTYDFLNGDTNVLKGQVKDPNHVDILRNGIKDFFEKHVLNRQKKFKWEITDRKMDIIHSGFNVGSMMSANANNAFLEVSCVGLERSTFHLHICFHNKSL